jgi:hypothetical protein
MQVTAIRWTVRIATALFGHPLSQCVYSSAYGISAARDIRVGA